MENALFVQMGGTYHQEGDYFLPDLATPERGPIGVWSQRHLEYIKKNRQAIYTAILLSGKLDSYLCEIDQQAEDMYSQIVKQMAERDGITERLKAENQMIWVERMNNIQSCAKEIVNAELIYT